ncbi:sensor histidine kinase [Streptomyces sp. WG5]|uniref:sensor histidine kinase n=1 Tax=Streptomyces sp. WG5 TaxID=3417648 RepID=UPI003CF26284
MSVSPPLPLLKRVPPGLWTALVWCTAAVAPVVEYVLMPPRAGYSLSYPRDGLAPLGARLLLLLAFGLVLAGCALLRRRTTVAYALVVAGTVVSTLAWRQDEIPPTQFLGVSVALGHVAAVRPRRTSLAWAGGTLAVLACYPVLRWVSGPDSGTAPEPLVALTLAVAWLVGHSVHQARAHTEELYARAAAQAVTAERLRIAREMHDTVAHSIGIIALQAGAAARIVDTRPDAAKEAMRTVERTGRETLSGLRRLLGALRQADQDRDQGQDQERDRARRSGADGSALRPAAGLADLERLAAATTAAGVRVDVRWRGTPRPVPAEVDLAAFRIVQEAVTNVVRHSGAGSCRVSVEHRRDELAVEVRDRGSGGAAGTETGYGLAGMRERAALLGGDFRAGPCPGGGFLVTARLPLPADAHTETETRTTAG